MKKLVIDDFRILPKSKVDVMYEYHLENRDFKLKKDVFYLIIVCNDVVKVSSISYVVELYNYALSQLKNDFTNCTVENSILFVIIEFKKGIKFVPDVRMFEILTRAKENIEKLSPGGFICVVEPEFKKSVSAIVDTIKVFAPNEHIALANSLDEVDEMVEEFKERFNQESYHS